MTVNARTRRRIRECVWDYPRPPRLEATDRHILVTFSGVVLADTRSALRVLETSHPPVYYLPPQDVAMQYLSESGHASFCEWKGRARYHDVSVGKRSLARAAWSYSAPSRGFAEIRDYVAFYPALVEGFVDGERVRAQPGDFYGGWITSELVGPFKGPPGTRGW